MEAAKDTMSQPSVLSPLDPLYTAVPKLQLSAGSSSSSAENLKRKRINLARLVARLEATADADVAGKNKAVDSAAWWETAGLISSLRHAQFQIEALRKEVLDQASSGGLEELERRVARSMAIAEQAHEAMTPPPAPSSLPFLRSELLTEGLDEPEASAAASPGREPSLPAGTDTPGKDDEEGTSLLSSLRRDASPNAQVDQPERDLPSLSLSTSSAPKGGAERESSMRDALLDDDEELADEYSRGPAPASPARRTPSPLSPNASTGRTSDTLLQHHRQTQESLSSDLLSMAGRLKANSLAFAGALERDKGVMEDAKEKLAGNLDGMTNQRARLKDVVQRAKGMGWLTLGSILVVIVSWVGLFIVIRLT